MTADWRDRIPEGVSGFEKTEKGFTAAVSIPLTDDGFLGRQCPDCNRRFTIDGDRYTALPDETRLTCCYCGSIGDPSDFLTEEQEARIMVAARTVAAEHAREAIGQTLRGLAQPRRPGSFVSIEVKLSPPGPITELPEIVEKQARRIITCPSCSVAYGVVGAVAYCPLCGRRGAADSVADAITASRQMLALEDALDEDAREIAGANGVLDRFSADAIKTVVTQYELAARADFERRVPTAGAVLAREYGNVFQRLDDVQRLYRDHAGVDLPVEVQPDRWERLGIAFQQRHVLTHLDGHVDQRYLHRVPGTKLALGQRLVVTRADAEQALADLEYALGRLSLAQPSLSPDE